jgi:hypothetical protein
MRLVRQGRGDALDPITRRHSQRLLEADRRRCAAARRHKTRCKTRWISAARHLNELARDASLEHWRSNCSGLELLVIGSAALTALGCKCP